MGLDCQVHVFGSFETRTYLPCADVDLVVECEGGGDKAVFEKLARVVERPGYAEQVQVIRHARVPIIKFVHSSSQIKFDLSVNKMDGVRHIKEFKRALKVYPELRYLIILIKCFLKQR